ncbi:MAG: ATP-binding cassette domain-containing protein [Solobacterium sp.]|nr:ATP-binding cassette domain-containing protein [Solobacterium sp.]
MAEQIKFENFTVRLRDRILYENLNFTINDGERYIFLGPNGIGKSLLLELIFLGNSRELNERYRGLKVTGSILDSSGYDLLDPSTRRRYSYVSQVEDFYKGMTIKEICETACRGIGIDLNGDKFDSLLNAFGIADKKNLKIKNNVSFGEGKIVHLISRLLKLEATNVLLLDEPLNHLSFKNSKVLNELLREEIRVNPSLVIVMVSHCRAMDFTDKAMVYDLKNKSIQFRSYRSYDCFTIDDPGNNDCSISC